MRKSYTRTLFTIALGTLCCLALRASENEEEVSVTLRHYLSRISFVIKVPAASTGGIEEFKSAIKKSAKAIIVHKWEKNKLKKSASESISELEIICYTPDNNGDFVENKITDTEQLSEAIKQKKILKVLFNYRNQVVLTLASYQHSPTFSETLKFPVVHGTPILLNDLLGELDKYYKFLEESEVIKGNFKEMDVKMTIERKDILNSKKVVHLTKKAGSDVFFISGQKKTISSLDEAVDNLKGAIVNITYELNPSLSPLTKAGIFIICTGVIIGGGVGIYKFFTSYKGNKSPRGIKNQG